MLSTLTRFQSNRAHLVCGMGDLVCGMGDLLHGNAADKYAANVDMSVGMELILCQ